MSCVVGSTSSCAECPVAGRRERAAERLARRFGNVAICCGVLLGGAWLATVGIASRLAAQEPAAGAPQKGPAEKTPPLPAAFDRTERCLTCHANLKSGTDFVANMSAQTWQDEDKHSRAFTLLETNAALTARILGFPLANVIVDGELRRAGADESQVTAVEKCLRCHATWPKGEPEPPVELRLGVSCQACHGPGFHWSRPHEEKWWRLCSAAEKERLGMRAVRHTTTKLSLCVSCHVGSVEDDRLVTHAMYAQGHPPLPGFEATAFSAQMPVHWRTLPEKKGAFAGSPTQPYELTPQDRQTLARLPVQPESIQLNYVAAHYPGHPHDPTLDLAAVKELAIGSLAVYRNQLRLLAADARKRQGEAGGWPEFALYDCRGCHHELIPIGGGMRPGWLGRPQPPRWTALGAALTIDGDARQAEWQRRQGEVDRAFRGRPFGRAAELAASAGALADWLDEELVRLERERFDLEVARRMLERWSLIESARPTDSASPRVPQAGSGVGGDRLWASSGLDYDAARLRAWGLETLGRVVREAGKDAAAGRYEPRWFGGPEGTDPLRLKLPAGPRGSVVESLEAAWDAPWRFEPRWYLERMSQFRAEFSRQRD